MQCVNLLHFYCYYIIINWSFIINNIWHKTQIYFIFKILIYTYIIIRLFLEEMIRHLIYENDSGNRGPVHSYWQANKNYGASESDLSIDYWYIEPFCVQEWQLYKERSTIKENMHIFLFGKNFAKIFILFRQHIILNVFWDNCVEYFVFLLPFLNTKWFNISIVYA
jgi:hypothetical protein